MTDLLKRYGAARVPRYTSYPTAPCFHDKIGPDIYSSWLGQLSKKSLLSLYLHVPYCTRLCWFCGCNTTITRRPQLVHNYAKVLRSEIEIVTEKLSRQMSVSSIHWGGGTPTILSPEDFLDSVALLYNRFSIAAEAEISIEIDPRTLNAGNIKVLAKSGVTRASLGVQDFTPKVQQAINRIQSFETVHLAVKKLRHAGIVAINLDLMIGLPYQTRDDVIHTVDLAAKLRPSRVTVFPYAHVPWLKKHQRMIREKVLPDVVLRREQADAAATALEWHGYIPVGQDHFALPNDPLAHAVKTHSLTRNFQGYTVDNADAVIGFGPSAIGTLPQGYVQNAHEFPAWRTMITNDMLATRRGIAFTLEDRRRRMAIENLMCHYSVDLGNLGLDIKDAVIDGATFNAMIEDQLVRVEGNRLTVTEAGRPFVRNLSSCLDSYFGNADSGSQSGHIFST